MAAVTVTKMRAARASALFAADQAAKASVVSVFTAADASRLWSADATVYVERPWASEPWMTVPEAPETAGAYRLPEKPAGRVSLHATANSVERILTSHFGGFAGGAFTQSTAIAEWLTLAWVENTASGATEKIVRVRDAWPHRVKFSAESQRGIVGMAVEYAGEATLVQALDAGGITLPTAPMEPGDKNCFTGRTVTLTRDPAGANVSMRFYDLAVTFDQGLGHDWDMMGQLYTVYRTGPTRARLSFTAPVTDESWVALTNSRAGTKERWQIVATAHNPAKTLTMNLYDVPLFAFRSGHQGMDDQIVFEPAGEAHKTAGNSFVSVTLT